MDASTLPPNVDQLARIIMLVYGRMREGKGSYWCYVAVRPSEYDKFRTLHKGNKINLYEFEQDGFGEVIVSGTGVTPPQEVTRQVAKVYGINIRDLFGDVDPQAIIAAKIAQMKATTSNANGD